MDPANYLLTSDIFPPSRVVPPYHWIGHIPFLQWLIAELRPSQYVELGAHTGNSFCAAAEALARSNPAAKAYAVDTWEGDHQAGYYGEEVFENLRAYVAATFPRQTELVRRRFADAAPLFADGSIDLLHIDGLHTYEAVAEDFRTWLPKVSDRGVILFHDTYERYGDFGVWKLWEEVTPRYPAFAFEHNHGLGVLLVGKRVPASIVQVSKYDTDERRLFRKIFELHGDSIYRQLRDEMNPVLVADRQENVRLKRQIDSMASSLSWRLTRPFRYLRRLATGGSARPAGGRGAGNA
jgi:hypothetical protein